MRNFMTTSFLALGIALANPVLAVTYVMPDIMIYHCGPQPTYAYTLDGSNVGRVWQQARCHGSGRGSKDRFYDACADVSWNADGTVQAYDVIWETDNRLQSTPAEQCIG